MYRKGTIMFSRDWLYQSEGDFPREWEDVLMEVCEAAQLGNSSDARIIFNILSKYLVPIETAREIEASAFEKGHNNAKMMQHAVLL